ncbi:unnamed protein product, partial [Musa textilis]
MVLSGASTIGLLGLERRLDPSSRTAVRCSWSLAAPRPLVFWVLSGGSTPHPERRFGVHGLER